MKKKLQNDTRRILTLDRRTIREFNVVNSQGLTEWIKQLWISNINYRLRECCFFSRLSRLVFDPIYDDLREKARLPKEKNFLKGLCIVWNEDMELERAEIPMFLSSNTRRATEWRRERAVLRFNLRWMKEDKCS